MNSVKKLPQPLRVLCSPPCETCLLQQGLAVGCTMVVMFSLVYLSRSNIDFTEADLLELLRVARDKNQRLAVTGLLLYKDGNFMQLLEGKKEVVTGLYETIRNDQRHINVNTIHDEASTARHFPDWSMGWQNLNKLRPGEVAGYNDFLTAPLTPAEFSPNPHRALRLLELFKTM